MKRSPLNPGASRLKRTGFLRHAALKAAGKPLKAVRKHDPAEKSCRAVVIARSGNWCEICGIRAGESIHHRRKQSKQGPWSPSNCVRLCGDGTTGCHGRITNTRQEYYDNGWLVRSWDDWTTVPFLHHTLGFVFLDDEGHYHIDLQEAS